MSTFLSGFLDSYFCGANTHWFILTAECRYLANLCSSETNAINQTALNTLNCHAIPIASLLVSDDTISTILISAHLFHRLPGDTQWQTRKLKLNALDLVLEPNLMHSKFNSRFSSWVSLVNRQPSSRGTSRDSSRKKEGTSRGSRLSYSSSAVFNMSGMPGARSRWRRPSLPSATVWELYARGFLLYTPRYCHPTAADQSTRRNGR
ncbi:hypothetical protein VTI74DRAFT_7015 [Chaetomium olivicolor]